jgi:hypothetical protein
MNLNIQAIKGLFLLVTCLFSVNHGNAQNSLNEIELYRIPQKKIRLFIVNQINNNITFFSDLHPSLLKDQDVSNLHVHQKEYLLDKGVDVVWKAYIETNPAKAWDGKKVSFGVLLSKKSDEILYPNDNRFDKIETGQVFYLNIGILRGIENLAVALEIINVDPLNKVIEFSYIKGGKAIGKQRIKFIPAENNITRIIHSSYFKSHSRFRDNFLYPYFHERMINEFHGNMENILHMHD